MHPNLWHPLSPPVGQIRQRSPQPITAASAGGVSGVFSPAILGILSVPVDGSGRLNYYRASTQHRIQHPVVIFRAGGLFFWLKDRTIGQTAMITPLKIIAHCDNIRTTSMVNFAYSRRVGPTEIACVSSREHVNGVVGTEGNMESSGDTVPRKAHWPKLEYLERKVEEAGESPEIICNPGFVCESRSGQGCDTHDDGCILGLVGPLPVVLTIGPPGQAHSLEFKHYQFERGLC
jgi:hypothetical protein